MEFDDEETKDKPLKEAGIKVFQRDAHILNEKQKEAPKIDINEELQKILGESNIQGIKM